MVVSERDYFSTGVRLRLVGSPFDDHPPKLSEKGVDLQGPPILEPTIRIGRQNEPTTLAMSSVKDHVNVGITGKALLDRCVRQRNATRNDK
jgi:hypothetical protein